MRASLLTRLLACVSVVTLIGFASLAILKESEQKLELFHDFYLATTADRASPDKALLLVALLARINSL